jgi:hypothetical protein
MAKEKGRKTPATDEMILVSFKLAKDLHKELEAYADTQAEESGKKLSPSLAARRLMLESLERRKKKV